MAEEQTCKGCGAAIDFIRNSATGNVMPVQKVRTLYALQPTLIPAAGELQKIEGLPGPFVYVSHFETCPKANEFSRGERRVSS